MKLRPLTAVIVVAASMLITTPAAAAGTRYPIGRWFLESFPGVSQETALSDQAPLSLAPLTATDTEWHADAHLIGAEALGFNGISSVAATAGPVLDTTGSFSVGARVRPTDLSQDRDFIGQDHATVLGTGQRGGFSVGLRRQGRAVHWTFRMGNGSSQRSQVVAATDPRDLTADALGRWTHVAASYDAAAHVMTLYINGVSVAQARRGAAAWAATGPLTIGRSDDGGAAHFWRGEVTWAQVYDRILTTADLFGGDIGGFDEAGMLDAFTAANWSFSAAVPCFLPEVPDTCNAPEFATFARTLQLTPGVGLDTDRAALAFDDSTYAFDADGNPLFNDDGTQATQPSVDEHAYLDHSIVHTNDAFSVAALVRLTDPSRPGPQTAVSLGSTGTQPAFALAYSNGAYRATLARSATPGDTVTVSAAVADPTTWHQLLAVYDPAQCRLRLYVDGVPAASATVSKASQAGSRVEVGRATTGDGYLFGAVDDLILWQGVVTGRQIEALADWQIGD